MPRPAGRQSRTAPPRRAASTLRAAPAAGTPPVASAAAHTGGILSNIAQTAAGVGLGHLAARGVAALFGSSGAVAHNSVDDQPSPSLVTDSMARAPCDQVSKLLVACMDRHDSLAACREYYEMLRACNASA